MRLVVSREDPEPRSPSTVVFLLARLADAARREGDPDAARWLIERIYSLCDAMPRRPALASLARRRRG